MNSINRLELKTKAKDVLRSSYWQCLAACLLTTFVTQAFSLTIQLPVQMTSNNISLSEAQISSRFITYFGAAYIIIMLGIIVLALAFSIFLTAPLTVGLKRFFIKCSQGEANIPVIADVFKSGNYLNIVKVSFMKNLFLALWMLTGIIPYMIIVAAFGTFSPSAFIEYAPVIVPVIAVISTIPYLVKYYSYFTVDYILAENPQISWREAMAEGKKMMRGNTSAAFLLQLSFIGWSLLGVLACGFGVIFVTPYIEATNAQLYLSLKTVNTETDFFEEF